MKDLDIIIINPDGGEIHPSMVDLPAYDEYMDRPRRLVAKIEKGSATHSRGTVKVIRRGKTILLGHIKRLDQSKPEHDTLTLDSAEAILEARIGAFYRYPAGTTLNGMLSEKLGESVVGLLAMANSLVPRGSFTQHSGAIYKWAGRGTASHLGAINQLFQGTALLTKVSGIPTSPGTWYQSSSDLYLWTTDSKSPDYHLILIPNFKDTLLRLGSLEGGDRTFPVCFEVGETEIFPTIKSMILAGGLEYQPRYGKDDQAYIDGKATIGKGSEASPIATYTEGMDAEISIDTIDDLGEIQALIGQGAGSGITRQTAAAMGQTTSPGVWREAIYQAPGLYGGMLQNATEKAFQDYADPTIYNIRTIDQDWAQSVGNYIEIRRHRHMPIVRRIKHIQMKPDGVMLLEAGQRLRTIKELLQAGNDIQRALSSFYGTHTKNAWSWGIDSQNIDSGTPLTINFELRSSEENGEIDPNFPYQVLLNVRLDWFKSSVKSATVGGASHGAVGSHSGYGGGETSDEEMTAHGITQKETTELSSGLFSIYAFSGLGPYGTNDASTNIGDVENAVVAFALEIDFEDKDWYFYDVDSESFSTKYHNHTFGPASQFLNMAGKHKHTLPAHNTSAAGEQHHTESTESAKTRAGSSQHDEQILTVDNNKIEYMLNWLPTGSAALLTLAITCNGQHVPGSPFTGAGGLYIGDRLDNIDISDLVSVGGNNTLVYQLSEYGGSNPVKCSLSGNVSVNAIISAF
jgi:hypothetical protein